MIVAAFIAILIGHTIQVWIWALALWLIAAIRSLEDAVYFALVTSTTLWLKGQHGPLISMATFEKVQKRLETTGYAPARADIGEDFSLRGFATCGDCGSNLRSSWSKGKTKYYPYYLCQSKGCDSYGKSIPRDKIESAFADVVKTLEPSPKYLVLVKSMFRRAWDARLAQAKDAARSTKRQIADTESQIEALLSRIMQASNDAVIGAYENKITELEKSKVLMAENLAEKASKPNRYEDY
ncbi:MAG: zinc ribbon domain-containing protein, partial [Paracoccaceae bacterium]|nr:zinc ribbon domain-containing protein [Paracoccaceae bacterium]